MSPPSKMKQEDFNRIYPASFSEATKERMRRELHIDPDSCSSEEFAWTIKKAKAKYKRELDATK